MNRRMIINFALTATMTSVICVMCISLTCCNKKPAQESSGPRFGGTARLPSWHVPSSLDPHSCTDNMCTTISPLIYETLISSDPQTPTRIRGDLASRWEKLPDEQSWLFHLRPEVVFHDDMCFPNGKGRTFVADDVIYSFQRWLKMKPFTRTAIKGALEYQRGASSSVAGLTRRDDSSIEISFDIKAKDIRTILPRIEIMPGDCEVKYGNKFPYHPVGTGPFRFVRWEPGQEISLVRNERYWERDSTGNRLPYLNEVIFSMRGNTSADFIAGNLTGFNNPVDFFPQLFNVPVSSFRIKPNIVEIFSIDRFTIINHPVWSVLFFGFTIGKKNVFNENIELRRAISSAIDRTRYLYRKDCFDPVSTFLFPGAVSGFSEEPSVAPDIDAAREHIQKAGIPADKIPPIRFATKVGEAALGQQLAEDLAKIGLIVDVQPVPFSELLIKSATGDVEMFRMRDFIETNDPLGRGADPLFEYMYSGRKDKVFQGYSDKEYDALYEAAIYEENPETRMTLLRKMNEIMKRDVVIIPMLLERCVGPNVYQSDLRNAQLPHKYWWFDKKAVKADAR